MGLVRVRPAEGVLSPPAQGTREALASADVGAFPWQVAFLGEIEPRAARPGIAAPASETSRPAPASAVKSPRWHGLSHGGGSRCLEVSRVAKAAV